MCTVSWGRRVPTTLGMAPDQVAAGRHSTRFLLLKALLLPNKGFRAPFYPFPGCRRQGLGNCVGAIAGRPLLQDHAPPAVARIHGEEVSPDALLHLVLHLVRQRRVEIDMLAKGLRVLWWRAESIGLRVVVVAMGHLAGSAFWGCSRCLLDGAEVGVIAGVVRHGRGQLLPGGNGGFVAVVDALRRETLGAAGLLERLLLCVVGGGLEGMD